MVKRSSYTVGYRKSPTRSQFKPGQSGNKKGRPKGAKSFMTDLIEELCETVVVREGAIEKRISKRRAFMKSLTANAVKGRPGAINALIKLLLAMAAEVGVPQNDVLTPDELEVLKTLEVHLSRLEVSQSTVTEREAP